MYKMYRHNLLYIYIYVTPQLSERVPQRHAIVSEILGITCLSTCLQSCGFRVSGLGLGFRACILRLPLRKQHFEGI